VDYNIYTHVHLRIITEAADVVALRELVAVIISRRDCKRIKQKLSNLSIGEIIRELITINVPQSFPSKQHILLN